MAKTITIKPEEKFARTYADRLILEKLAEMESAMRLGELADSLSSTGIGLGAVRSLLASKPECYTYHERRWIPTARVEGQGKPFQEAMRLQLERFGAPMPLGLLVQELSRIRGTGIAETEQLVLRVVTAGNGFLITLKNEVAWERWAFLATDESVERAIGLNELTLEEVEALRAKLGDVDWRNPNVYETVLKLTAPVKVKAIAAVAWLALNKQEPHAPLLFDGREFFARVCSVDGYVFGADGVIYPQEETRKWIVATVKLADKLAPMVDVEDAAPVAVKPEDVDRMVAKVLANEESTTALKLLEEIYEITPANKTFPDDIVNVISALKARPEVEWVGGDRFRIPGTAPENIFEVPEPFLFPTSEHRDSEGELIDVELTDEGLSSSLRKLLQHPLATDVLDEEIMPAPKQIPEQLRLVLKSTHRELGTFPMCQFPSGWLDPTPNIQELIFIDPNGRELSVWANHEARLLFNIFWWLDQPIESGAVFSLQKTSKPNVLEFQWLDQTDPVVYISSQRMEELREIGEKSADWSVLDILIEVMAHWPKGADFLTVLAEMNVVRRCRRRLVASLLSSYQCFYQRSGSPVWHFDPKKVDLGFDKTKKKFIKK